MTIYMYTEGRIKRFYDIPLEVGEFPLTVY